MTDPTPCLNCGEPSEPGGDKAPLCMKCKRLAAGNERGVKFRSAEPPKEDDEQAGGTD